MATCYPRAAKITRSQDIVQLTITAMGIGGLQVEKPIDKKTLKRLRDQGWKLKEIAAHFNCGIDHISVAIRKYGLPLRGGGRRAGKALKT